MTLEERLLARRRIDPETGCWEWTGKRLPTGYGKIKIGGRQGKFRSTHRVAAMLWLDFDIDDKHDVLHHCDNPPCFNPGPGHLFIGDDAANAQDRARKRRGREAHQDGAKNPNARLTEAQVSEVLSLLDAGATQISVGEQFGIKQPQVSRIARGVSWRNIQR
jgi:hypothetical protein